MYHFEEHADLENKTLRTWLWISVAAAVIGAMRLYPIGTGFADFLFIIVKASMIGGLLTMLLKKDQKGYPVWAWASAGAVLMTLIKWLFAGHFHFIFLLAIAVDLIMPAYACTLSRKKA